MNEVLLVTGGAGFIGSNFVHYWINKYPKCKLIVLDALTYAGNIENLKSLEGNPDFKFVHGDINDRPLVESILKEHRVNTIVHFAAESHVDRSIHGPDPFMATNVMGTYSLLQAAKKIWLDSKTGTEQHRFHHISTDEVYGTLDFEADAFTEQTPYDPSSPYAASKAASDHLVRAYNRTYGLCTTISNCSNNYGPFHFPEKLIPLIIINILKGKPLPVYGDGKNIRDWLYVTDHCRGIELILGSGNVGETYNIGGNNECSNIDIVNSICSHIDVLFSHEASINERFPDCPAGNNDSCASLIKFVKDRPGHDLRYAINAHKIQSQLGFNPAETMDSGLEKTIRWYLDNAAWWQNILDEKYQAWIDTQYNS